jgi:hypothetical protein
MEADRAGGGASDEIDRRSLDGMRAVESAGSGGLFFEAEQTEAAPADTEEPGARGDDGGRIDGDIDDWGVIVPAVEPPGGGAGVEGGDTAAVLASVEEYVGQGVADLARGAELAAVVAVRPDRATATGGTVEGAGGADHEAAHARGESGLVAGLGNEVQVVSLDGEVNQAKVGTRGGGDGGLEYGI